MIGGYLAPARDADLEARLRERLDSSWTEIPLGEHGFFFHDGTAKTLVTDEFVALTPDLLVAPDADGEYREIDLGAEFTGRFLRNEAAAFDAFAGDVRMAVLRRSGEEAVLYLASHRAGSGRMYYAATGSGILFASDLRFLLGALGGRPSPLGIYAILKYGAVPEPLTVGENVSAVPVAHYLRCELRGGAQRTAPYFRFRFPCETEAASTRSEGEVLAPARAALRRSARFLAGTGPAILLSGGIDSSLYGAYLAEAGGAVSKGFYCAFGDEDPEFPYARQIAERVGADLDVARMGSQDALSVLESVTKLTDHPFSDFSSLPITFLLRHVAERMGEGGLLIECNGGDDCFGFPDLENEKKATLKHRFPRALKGPIASVLGRTGSWKWKSREGFSARLAALADAHECTPLDYFLVLAPVRYLGLEAAPEWDHTLHETMESVFAAAAEDHDRLGYRARATVRQLLHVNSRRWAAKALSVGESLGMRVIYPYIWREVLVEQGRIPWDKKVREGVVKWPLKRLLEEFMPEPFIYRPKSGFVPPFARWLTEEGFNGRVREVLLDREAVVARVASRRILEALLADAREGRELRHPILNFLWAALFTELWLAEHGR
jgi:asparagine synthase (glutamine-hydrolysing)